MTSRMSLGDRGDHESVAEALTRLTGGSVETFEFDGEIPALADLDEEWVDNHFRELLEE